MNINRILIIIVIAISLSNHMKCQNIQLQTLESLYLVTVKDGKPVNQGTGFIIKPDSNYYLITNWHIVTNKNPQDGNWIDTANKVEPDIITIKHRSPKGIEWHYNTIELLKDKKGNNLYKEFKFENEIIDVVAIPLRKVDPKKIQIFPVDYKNTFDGVGLMPTDILTIVGYPLGMSSALDFPIWKSGSIASEPALNQEGKPIIWVDMLGFGGMSGSPVYYIKEDFDPKRGNYITGARFTYFMGIFSHGNPNVQLAALWKSTYLEKLFDSLE